MNNIIKKTTIYMSVILGTALVGASMAPTFANQEEIASLTSIEKGTRTIYDQYPEIEDISMGINQSAAVVNKNGQQEMYVWGYNGEDTGTLGNGETDPNVIYETPTLVENLPFDLATHEIKDISVGQAFSAMIVTDKTTNEDKLYTWGSHANFLLNTEAEERAANGEDDNIYTPTEIDKLDTFIPASTDGSGIDPNSPHGSIEGWELKKVEVGTNTAILVANDGTSDHLLTWGANSWRQLGIGRNAGTGERSYLMDITEEYQDLSLTNPWDTTYEIKDINASDFEIIVTVDQGANDAVYLWGRNQYGFNGIDGDGGNDRGFSPLMINSFTDADGNVIQGDIKDASVSDTNMSFILDDGTNDHLFIWGNNSNDVVFGNPTDGNVLAPYETYVTKDNEELLMVNSIKQGQMTVVKDTDTNEISVYANGLSTKGSLGLGTDNASVREPIEMLLPEGIQEVKQIVSNTNGTSIVINDGELDKVYTFGNNSNHTLGIQNGAGVANAPIVIDFAVEPEMGSSLINTISLVLMIITILAFIGVVIIFVVHKVHHKEAMNHIEENSLVAKEEE